MKIKQDSEVYVSCEAAFLEATGRSVKVCIDQPEMGSAKEREALFMTLLTVIASRISGHSGGSSTLSGATTYPVIGYMRDGDDAVYFGNSSRLHELAPPLTAALAGVEPKVFLIDGSQFSTLDGFYDEISLVLIPGTRWGHGPRALSIISLTSRRCARARRHAHHGGRHLFCKGFPLGKY